MRLYRSMQVAPDGYPVAGPGGRLLGVRPGSHPNPDVLAIAPTNVALPGHGGLSVAPDDPLYLPTHRRTASLAGTGRDPVWYIETEHLGPDLEFRQDRQTHGLVEPRRPITFADVSGCLGCYAFPVDLVHSLANQGGFWNGSP
jgi:hypothetical protein